MVGNQCCSFQVILIILIICLFLTKNIVFKIEAAAFPSLTNLRCWYRKIHFTCPLRSQICSNKSACEQEFADLLCVISFNNASIPASTVAAFPLKKDFRGGFIFSRIFCCFTSFFDGGQYF